MLWKNDLRIEPKQLQQDHQTHKNFSKVHLCSLRWKNQFNIQIILLIHTKRVLIWKVKKVNMLAKDSLNVWKNSLQFWKFLFPVETIEINLVKLIEYFIRKINYVILQRFQIQHRKEFLIFMLMESSLLFQVKFWIKVNLYIRLFKRLIRNFEVSCYQIIIKVMMNQQITYKKILKRYFNLLITVGLNMKEFMYWS